MASLPANLTGGTKDTMMMIHWRAAVSEAAIILGGKSEWVERVFTAQRCHLFFSAGETIDSAAHTICALAIGHEKEYIASRDLNLIRNRKYAIVSQ